MNAVSSLVDLPQPLLSPIGVTFWEVGAHHLPQDGNLLSRGANDPRGVKFVPTIAAVFVCWVRREINKRERAG